MCVYAVSVTDLFPLPAKTPRTHSVDWEEARRICTMVCREMEGACRKTTVQAAVKTRACPGRRKQASKHGCVRTILSQRWQQITAGGGVYNQQENVSEHFRFWTKCFERLVCNEQCMCEQEFFALCSCLPAKLLCYRSFTKVDSTLLDEHVSDVNDQYFLLALRIEI
jgi:hypothetical protein